MQKTRGEKVRPSYTHAMATFLCIIHSVSFNYYLFLDLRPPPLSPFESPFLSFPLCAFSVRKILWSLKFLAQFQEYDGHYHFGLSSLFSLSLAAVTFPSLKILAGLLEHFPVPWKHEASCFLGDGLVDVVTERNWIMRQMTMIQSSHPAVLSFIQHL